MPFEVKEKVVALSVAHPSWGRKRISDQLKLEEVSVSPSTIRNIWRDPDPPSKIMKNLVGPDKQG
jgi:hypothetical protein